MIDVFSLGFSVSNLGPKTFQKLLNAFGSSESAWKGTKAEYEELGLRKLTYKTFDEFRKVFDDVQYTGHLKKEGVEFIAFTDKRYPNSLKKIENPPIGLYCKGNTDLLSGHSERSEESKAKILRNTQDDNYEILRIGVVGTRKITQYGKDVTEMLVSDLVRNGVAIVSGLALGVDAKAHRVTLENNGLAIAVLACGVDCCTPSENYNLYSEILKNNGLIISEYPLSVPPFKGTFLARNRIVAALSDGLLITEAAEGSGSLITAQYALQYGKKVFAVPGQITSRMSDGNLKLLKQGATLVSNVEDIFEELSIKNQELRKKKKFENLQLSNDEKMIVSLIENEGLTIDEIAKKSNIKINMVFVAISGMEMRGLINNTNGKIGLSKESA